MRGKTEEGKSRYGSRPNMRNQKYTRNPEDSFISEDSFTEEENLEPVSEVESKKTSRFIRITHSFRTRWDLFTMLLAVYNCFTVPFMVAFWHEESIEFFVINTLIDCVFMIDIGFNFFTTFIDRNGDEVLDHKKIVDHYIKGSFWKDFLASFPLDNFLVMFGNMSAEGELIQFFDLLKLMRILRLSRIIRFTRTRDDIKATMKLMQLTLYLVMWVHLTGCLWYMIVKPEEEWVPLPDFLTGETNIYHSDIWTEYFICFYHAVWLLTGGEVAPRNTEQAFIASMLFIIGALITAVLFGEMAVLMSILSRRETQFQEILDGALTTMNNMNLPKDLTNRILDYITSTQSQLSAQEEYETFEKFISPSLSQEVSACIYDPIISKNCILASEERLTESLMHKLHNMFTKPEVEIIREGTESNSLYFLVNGECQVLVTDRYKEKISVCCLSEGSHFGEIGLVYGTLRTASVVGTGYCTIAELQKKDYESLTASFPHLVKKFKICTEVYNDPWKKFLQKSLCEAPYFKFLPSSARSELVYMMDIFTVDKGDYLFKPGEKATSLYIVAEGELELSWTVNDMHMHLMKKEAKVRNMEKPPKIAKKTATLDDFPNYRVDYSKIEGVKAKAEIVPYMNESEITGVIFEDEELPEQGELIGDYPQEIVLQIFNQGTLINSKLALVKHTYSLQCKALKNSTIYALKIETINSLGREHSEFKAEIQAIIEEIESEENFLALDPLDYHLYEEEEQETTHVWKQLIVKLNLNLRVVRMKGTSQIALMVAKLQAIFACERAENFALAEQVQRGEIPPHYIQEDGTLDPQAQNSDGNSQLPKSHPIMKAFRDIFEEITIPDGNIVKEYTFLEEAIVSQTERLEAFEAELIEMKKRALVLKEEGKLPTVKRNERFKLDMEKVEETTMKHREKRQARKVKEEEKKENLEEFEERDAEMLEKKPTDLLSFIKK